ncbi:hypothetical protein ACIQC5_11780 [Paenarthrobacter sp. NPDC092416]|uniref:hypothetical protein n=1 Tax=Paenarthrobacter sp. NPDC092416 TaxID=3364386 RepID=UPI0037FDF999
MISLCGALPGDGITAHDTPDAAIKRAMMGASRRSVLVAEASKLSGSATAAVCEISDFDALVTDKSAPDDLIDR